MYNNNKKKFLRKILNIENFLVVNASLMRMFCKDTKIFSKEHQFSSTTKKHEVKCSKEDTL